MTSVFRKYLLKDICIPDYENPYLEQHIASLFLPLEEQTPASLETIMKQEGASEKFIQKAVHLLNGIHAFRQHAAHYMMTDGREQQGRAYQRSARFLEAHLRLMLYDAFPHKTLTPGKNRE